ncbi:hypothetical protein CWM83_21385, partial [Klebsiella pneumoniae]
SRERSEFMQLKICIKRSLAHILCSHAKKRCNFKQRSANIRQQFGSSGAVRSSPVTSIAC